MEEVDEFADQAFGSKIELTIESGPALFQDVGPVLLDRAPGLYGMARPGLTGLRDLGIAAQYPRLLADFSISCVCFDRTVPPLTAPLCGAAML
ncbi:MAG: hypothetical protein WA957_03745 [Alteraurantiacibacter sp.]